MWILGTTNPTTKFHINGGLLRIDNSSRYVTIGSENTSYCHYKTNADEGHWFNKTVLVDGNIVPYGNNEHSAGTTSNRFSNVYSYSGNFAGTIASNNYHQIYNNGSYTNQSGNVTGAIVIQLPITSDQWDMINVEIAVYEYNSQSASKIIVGGHPWKGNWYNYSCSIIGGYNREVRLGIYGGKFCIILGTSSTVWSYLGVFVTHIGTVYDIYSSAYASQCTLSLVTSESGFSGLVTPTNVVKATSADTSNRTKFLETFYQGSTTETFGSSYPIWAQWENSTNVRLKCTNYTVWTDKSDYASSAGDADTIDGKHANEFATAEQGVGTVISITKSLTPTTSWTDTGIKTDSSTFPGGNGSYIVQISVPSSSGVDGWGDLYTGYFALFTETDSSTEDEILLHVASHSLRKRIYLKTKATSRSDGTMHFYISSENAFSAARSINFKFRKLI